MIKLDIDIKNQETATIRISGSTDVISLEFYEIFEQLDKNCQSVFRASVFAYINTREDILRDYAQVSGTELSKIVTSIIRERKDAQE